MSWAAGFGFNFRMTAGYVTDGAGEHYVIDSRTYPTVFEAGVVGGMNAAKTRRGRDKAVSGSPPRLSGGQVIIDNEEGEFILDLPAAGTYNIGLACGLTDNQTDLIVRIYDTASLLLTIGPVTFAGGNWRDATNTTYNAAGWLANQATVPLVFATTQLRALIGSSSNTSGDQSSLAHLFVQQVASGGSSAIAAISAGYHLRGMR